MPKYNYPLSTCESLIDRYINEYGGEALQLEEGVLGLGKILLHSAEGKKTIVINEYYINPWTSGHSIRKYNEIPKKYQKEIDNV